MAVALREGVRGGEHVTFVTRAMTLMMRLMILVLRPVTPRTRPVIRSSSPVREACGPVGALQGKVAQASERGGGWGGDLKAAYRLSRSGWSGAVECAGEGVVEVGTDCLVRASSQGDCGGHGVRRCVGEQPVRLLDVARI